MWQLAKAWVWRCAREVSAVAGRGRGVGGLSI